MKYHVLVFPASRLELREVEGVTVCTVLLSNDDFSKMHRSLSSVHRRGSEIRGEKYSFKDWLTDKVASVRQVFGLYKNQPSKIEKANAIYTGRKGAFGYETNQEYNINILTYPNGSVRITRKGFGGKLIYPNRLMFEELWKLK